jgi:hypothetical protein
MTPEQAYNELKELYRIAHHCIPRSHDALLSWANSPETNATYAICHHRWTYRMAESMVNRCRELAPLAMQHQP